MKWRSGGGFISALQETEGRGPAPDFGEKIVEESYRLAREGLQRENRTCMISAPKTAEQRRLESWGVILQEEGFLYRFKHDNLQDFLYARYATSCGYMVADVLAEIADHRTRNILAWMEKLYRANHSPRRLSFMQEILGV